MLHELITSGLVERLRDIRGHDQELGARLRRAEARLEELAAAWAAEDITSIEWRAARDVLEKQVQRDRTWYQPRASAGETTAATDRSGPAD